MERADWYEVPRIECKMERTFHLGLKRVNRGLNFAAIRRPSRSCAPAVLSAIFQRFSSTRKPPHSPQDQTKPGPIYILGRFARSQKYPKESTNCQPPNIYPRTGVAGM